jgi:alkylated DNA repair protein (DNA oxidative demethylase)
MNTVSPISRRKGVPSRLGGVPTSLPAVDASVDRRGNGAGAGAGVIRQLALAIDEPGEAGDARQRSEVRPDVVHLPDWLDHAAQRDIVEQFRRWAEPPAGLRHPRVPAGHVMTVQSVCLGWHWHPYAYSRTADDTDGAPVKPLPANIHALGRAAVAAAYGPSSPDAETYDPDAAIVNLYAAGAHLGLHQDDEEPASAPVVTISIGDTCVFRMAGIDRRTGPFTDVELRSGDLLVFGRANRRIFHGVPKVLPDTAPDGLGLPPGRLSLTLRETGFTDD